MAQLSTNATIRKYVSLRVALIGALVIALAGSAYYVLEHWPQRGGSYPASAFEVPQGASLNQIATELERRGVIEKPPVIQPLRASARSGSRVAGGKLSAPGKSFGSGTAGVFVQRQG